MNYTRNKDQMIRDLQAHIADLERKVKEYEAEKNDKSARTDMRQDGKIDLQNISPSMARQMVTSFYQNYDKQSRQNIEDLRHREGGDNPDVIKYDAEKKVIDELKARFDL